MTAKTPLPLIGSRILVTGSEGFLGRTLVPRLHELGADVVPTARREGSGTVRVDLTIPTAIQEVVDDYRPDWVIHCAASVPRSLEQYGDDSAAALSVGMTENVIAACPRRLLFISSMTVYGVPETLPVSEDVALQPVTAYALGKAKAEQLVASSGIPGYAARIPGLYGGDRKSGLVYNLVATLKEGREPSLPNKPLLWSAMDVGDAVEAITGLLATAPSNFQAVNIGYAGEVSINAMAEALSARAGCSSTYSVQHPSFSYNLNRYKALTGKGTKTFEQAFEEMWNRA